MWISPPSGPWPISEIFNLVTFLILEAVRQLRGEWGDRQIKDHNIALVNGTGGSLSSTGTTVLAVD